MKAFNVAVVGATGAVGNEMIETLEARDFPVKSLKLLASERSVGVSISYRGRDMPVEVLDENSFKGVEIGLFSAGGSVSQKFAPIAAESGCVVIDNTSAFRMEPDVPLVVPEVNPHAITDYKKRGIIANPNCSTIQMVVALKPLHDAARIKTNSRLHLPGGLRHGQEGHRRTGETGHGHLQQQEVTTQGLPPSDRLQLPSPHRRLPRERLHQGRDEDGQRDEEDHGRRLHPGDRHHRAGARVLRPLRSPSMWNSRGK